MAVTSGFFDGINHDRRYTAAQWGHIMDYLIMDGVYAYYPSTGIVYDDTGHRNKTLPPFKVTPIEGTDAWKVPNGYGVAVGPGRAWFDGTWTHITTPEIIGLDAPDPAGDRIDVICLQMNKSAPVRANRIVVKRAKLVFNDGLKPLSQYLPLVPHPGDEHFPVGSYGVDFGNYDTLKDYYPELQGAYMHDDEVHDVPLAYIVRRKDSERVLSTDIYSAVGTQACPYVTNIADGAFSVEDVYLNWSTQFGDFWNGFQEKVESEYEAWHTELLALDPQWRSFLENRSADFMSWLKMYDRAYHVWYQGSVNWTYEFIRNLETEEKDFSEKWSSAIQKAQDLLENGFTEYTQKIDEILQRFEDLDSLVDSQMEAAQKAIDEAVSAAKQDIQNGAKELLETVVTEQMETIVTKVVENSYDQLRDDLGARVENLVKDELDTSFADRLKALEDLLDAYHTDALDALNRQIASITETYTTFQENIEYVINQQVETYLAENEDLQAALDKVAQDALRLEVSQQLTAVREEWMGKVHDELYETLSNDVETIFTERFESEKESLVQYVKDQVRTITDTAVDERFQEDFAAKQTELEAKIDQYAADAKQELAEALTVEVQNKFNEQFDAKYTELETNLDQHVTDTVTDMRTSVRDELQRDLSSSLTESLRTYVDEKSQDNKVELAEGLSKEVQTTFDQQFSDKQTELEQNIKESVDTGVSGLEGQLDAKVDAKFEQVEQQVADSAEKLVTERINQTLATVFKFKGTGPFAHLPQVLDSSMEGNVYNVKDVFTTDDRFVEGAGQSYFAGTNVVVVDAGQPEFDPGVEDGPSIIANVTPIAEGSVYKFDIFPGFIDLTPYATNEDIADIQKQITELSGSIRSTVTEQLSTIQATLATIQDTLATHTTDIQAANDAASTAQTAADAAKTTAGAASSAASTAQTGVNGINTRLENDFLEKG